mmetsp:Transcript_16838/g.24464  ORF Transcript_16838/g.24464 Transcript_16838/m.24464 type:complete len:247 (-) Transcript_16838:100-840(-)
MSTMMLAASRRMIPHAARRSGIAASVNMINHPSTNNSSMNSVRYMSELPYHLVVPMPALSPTMEAGTISSWKIAEGESFSAGDSLAEIETDKATIDFEAQDDGVVAKILVESGAGEITVGVPIMVTVEEEDDVAAFKDYVPEAAPAAVPAAEETPAAPAPVQEVVAPPTPPPVAAAPPTPPPVAAAPVAPPPPVVEEPVVAAAPAAITVGPAWGRLSKVSSPIVATLSADQKKYIEMYGSTGQIPL